MILLEFYSPLTESASGGKGFSEEFEHGKVLLKRLEALNLSASFELQLSKDDSILHISRPHEVVQITLVSQRENGQEHWTARLPSTLDIKPLAHAFVQNEGVLPTANLLQYYIDQEEYRKKVKLEQWRATQKKGRKVRLEREWKRWGVSTFISLLFLAVMVRVVTLRHHRVAPAPSTKAVTAYVKGVSQIESPEPYQLILAEYRFMGKNYVRPVVVKGTRNYRMIGDSVEVLVHVYQPERAEFVP